MLRVVPPERLRWSKESKAANKENETSVRTSQQDGRTALRTVGDVSSRQCPVPTSADLSSVDNLRGTRPSEGRKSRPVKAVHVTQSEGEETADTTLNAKHKRRVSLKDLCAADKQRVRQLVEELARVTAEKEKVEARLTKERRRFERVLQQMQQEQQRAAQERAHLEQSLQETQLQLQMASSKPYHDDHAHSVARPPTGTELAKLSSQDNSMRNGCPGGAPPSSEDESVTMRGFKSPQYSQPDPAPRFELYSTSSQPQSGELPSLSVRQEASSTVTRKGVSLVPIAPSSHLRPAQTCDVGVGTGTSPVVPRVTMGTTPPPLGVEQLAVPHVSVCTQTASTVGTQTLSPQGVGSDGADTADVTTCSVPHPRTPYLQPPPNEVKPSLTHPQMGQEDSKYLRASQIGALPPKHVLSGPGNQPPSLQRAISQPPSLPTAVNQPSSLQMEESQQHQQLGTMMAAALQSAQSTLGTNGFREQLNMAAPSGSPPPPPPLDPAWEVDVIEALNNTSLHTVASWAGPHSISTPITKRRREEADTHRSLLSTTAPQDKDLLEELFFLR